MALSINGTTGVSGVDGSASAPALTGTDSNTGINFASDTVNINTGGTTRATIDSSGKLNLTSNIKWSSANPFVYSFNGGSSGQVRSGIQFDGTNQQLAIYTSTNERVRIDNVGKTMINTTSHQGGHYLSLKSDGGASLVIRRDTSNGAVANFMFGGSFVGSIGVTGSSTSYNTSSDYRLKENVIAISDGITRLKTLKPSRFNFIADAEKTVDGFLAHEVTAVPEAITGTKDQVATDDNQETGVNKGDPIYQKIDQSKLVPLLTAALQEAIAKIEVLETKVAALEAA